MLGRLLFQKRFYLFGCPKSLLMACKRLVMARLSYGMWLLVPWPGIEPGPHSIESTALTCEQGSPLLGSFCFKFHPAGFPGADHDSWRQLKGKECQWTNTISSGGIENTFAWLNPWRQASGKRCHCHGDVFKGNDQKKKKKRIDQKATTVLCLKVKSVNLNPHSL